MNLYDGDQRAKFLEEFKNLNKQARYFVEQGEDLPITIIDKMRELAENFHAYIKSLRK